jgi:uncharacterized membrane protein YeaQ/YmgE (transglycosylase-associated protein family)
MGKFINLSNRSTTDVVVILFSCLVCIVLTIMIVGAITARLVHPEMDLSKISESVTQIISTIVGALVGFISGRAYGRRELNGEKDRHD